MIASKQQEIIDWAIEKLQSYEKEKKLYNISGIILSILDVVCGIIALFCTGMLVTSVVASILCGTVWSARTIQFIKCKRLAQSLKVLTATSLTYIAVRKRRGEFMKNIKVRNIVIAILSVLGFASVIICHFVPVLTQYIDYAIYYLCALLPVDLYAVFNNARLSAEQIEEKANNIAKKKAEKEAKNELEAKQKAELEALTAKKLEEQAKSKLVAEQQKE